MGMGPLPNLRHLRFLVALHDHLHFGKAATACFVTQSTLSAGIRELETSLGVSVAERTKRSVLITPVGRRVVAMARKLLQEAELLMATGSEEAQPMFGQLELGVIPTVAPFLLPKLVPAVGKRFPRLWLSLREDTTRHLLDWLIEGRLDLVLMAFPYETGRFETFMLFEDAYRFVSTAPATPRHQHIAGEPQADGQNLLLLEHDHCLHSHALPVLQRAARTEHASFSSTSLHTLVAMVAEGMGATFLPDLAINGGILKGQKVIVRPLPERANARTIGLCWRRGSPRAESFRRLGEFMREWSAANLKPWSDK